jgi:hypothetical protein
MRFLFIIILQIASVSLFAQGLDIKNKEFTFSFGFSEYNVHEFPINDDLDFLNYAYSDPEILDFGLLKLGYRFDFLSNFSADMKLIMQSDLVPNNYDFSVSYRLNKKFGIGIGSMLTNTYISYFEEYQYQTLPEYYLTDENLRQFKAYDLAFYVSPHFSPIQNDRFRATIKCDIGLSSFLREQTAFYHKRNLSNERLLYDYHTKIVFQPYVNPKVELRLKTFEVKSASVGFLLNTNLFISNRSINYNRTIQQWTSDNEQVDKIKTPKHNYSRFEMDFGLYIKW